MSTIGWIVGLLTPYAPAGVIALVTLLLAWLVNLLLGRLLRSSVPRAAATARHLGVGVVGLIGGTLVLQALGINTDVLLVIIAIVGATVVVALREPLGNYGAKYFGDIYTPFKVGDTIRVLGYAGKVIEINPMTTVLLTDDDLLVSVPNVALIRDVLVNTSPQAWKEVVIPVTLPASVDLPAFESGLLKSLAKLRARLDRRFPPVVTTRARTPQATDLTVTLMLQRPEDRDVLAAEANKRIAETLERIRGTRR